jgi:hypothetical protein
VQTALTVTILRRSLRAAPFLQPKRPRYRVK